MNVNLVSPLDNGNNFVVRFKEDIVVPQNSKVYLNFASLSRQNDVELYEDQEITLLFDNADIRPNLLPNRDVGLPPFRENKLMAISKFKIAKGTYNYASLYTNITTGINALLRDALNPADLLMYRAVAVSDVDSTDAQIVQGQVSFSFGLMKNYIADIPHTDFNIDAGNFRNGDNQGGAKAYIKTSANAIGPTGLRKTNTAGGGAFNADDTTGYVEGNTAMNVQSVVGQQLQNADGSHSGGTIDFDIISGGRLKMTNSALTGIGNAFQSAGTANKNDGAHIAVPLLGGSGSGALVSLVVAGGAVTFSSLNFDSSVGGAVGAGYAVGDILTIANTGGIGGTADTTLEVKSLLIGIDYTTIRVNAIGDNYSVGQILKISNLVPNTLGGSTHNTIAVQTLQVDANVPFFDNYALSNGHYWHIGYDDNTPYSKCNIIKFTTEHSPNDMVAGNMRCVLGLASSEVALGINASDGVYPLNSGKRTGGVNAVTSDGASLNPQNTNNTITANPLNQKNLAGFITIEVDCSVPSGTPYLNIRMAQTGTGNVLPTGGIQTWDSCNKPIDEMSDLFVGSTLALRDIKGMDFEQPVSFGLQTYYAQDNLEDKRLYFRVLNLNVYHDPNLPVNDLVIYDSRSNNHFIPDAFFKCENPAVIDYGTTSNFPSDIAGDTTTTAGTADKTDGQKNNINVTDTTGSGAGLQVSFLVAGGAVDFSSLVVDEGGDGYKVGDVVTLPSNQGVGGSPNTKLTIKHLGVEKGANRINSQLPFNVIVGALNQNDGFSKIEGPFFTKNDAKPLSYIHKYEIEATGELSRYLNLHSLTDRLEGHAEDLFPNTGDAMNPNMLHLEGMNLDWRNESYSISLKELPIKNFKNTESKSQGGFGKTILANCPVPFSDAQSYATKTKQMITATYKPNYQIVSNLYNQAFTTNHFSVEIRKLATDKPANEIEKSIVNFTIMPPDDYTGNINSVDLLRGSTP